MASISNKQKKQKGFTLLGVLISLFLVTVGIVGFVMLFRSLEAAAIQNKNELTAGFLAQEGIEIVRRSREASNKTDWSSWYSGLTEGDYNVVYSDDQLQAYSHVPLKLDPTTLSYNYTTGNDTIFYRKINLDILDVNMVKVTCTVDWSFKGGNYQIVLQDQLYNWR